MEPEAVLARAQKAGAAYAEVRIEETEEQRIRIEDGELENLVAGKETGFGLRVLVDGAWGFASSNALDTASWKDAVDVAVRLARAGATDHPVTLAAAPVEKREEVWRPVIDPRGISVEDKRALLADMDHIVRVHPEIKTVTTAYSDTVLRKEFWNTDGAQIRWGLTRSVAQINFTARRDGHLAGRSTRVGGTRGWELFAHEDPVAKASEAAKSCVAQLGARSPKGGRTTVVLDPELAGVFAHEAVGHAAEADLVAAGESCFRDRIGDRLGVAGLTIHDDSRVEGSFGSVPYDDNGVRGQDKRILEDGRLVGYLLDRERAASFGMAPNGASRAQDFSNRPLIRMSNTLIAAGDVPEAELLGGVKEGVFCRGSRGGQVDTARGSFLFNAQDAFVIRDGEIAEPLRDVSLTGDILQTLHAIDALGDEQRLGDPGYCGKGQWVPVCDGGPLVRIRDCLVGGAG